MEKTKLGISVGLLGAAIFASALFGGYVITFILAGYVLLREENEWLKKAAVKAVATAICFSILVCVIGLIPDALGWVASVINIFGANLYFNLINEIFTVITTAIVIIKDVVFLLLIFKSLNQGTIKIPVVDDLINKYM